ncbi:MAG: xanthine dehydrogenase family protein molybdopterin-binding subunit [Acidobacteria bacterium]|nr:xanthine dehydrogenase family protein molybdopterin-binding subunit [Acidobacteriota bacterium]
MQDRIGTSAPRREAASKVSGRSIYTDDAPSYETLYGVTVRSTVPHARIRKIHFAPDLPLDEFTIVSADDLPGPNVVASICEDQPCLASSKVNHVEEAILLIAHPDRYLAERARQSVCIEYDPLPAVFNPALSTHAFKTCNISKGLPTQAFANAPHIIEGTYTTGAQEQLYIEPQSIDAAFLNNTLTIWGSMQCPYFIQKALDRVFPFPSRVIQMETGGGFGGKEDYPSILAIHAGLLSWKSGKPVKMIYSRGEDMAATTKRHPAIVKHRTAVDAQGRLLAMEVDILLDGGAYATLSPVVLSRAAIHATGCYFCPDIQIEARAVATNHPPHGAFRGFGVPQVNFALERHMDVIAASLRIDPVTIRRRNFLQQGQRTATGQVLHESVPLQELLDRALLESSYESKSGLGIAASLHGAGFTGSGERYLQSVACLERTAEGKIRVLVSSTEFGQGTNTILSQIVADELQLPLDDIEIVQPDTSIVPDSGPTVASRTAMIVGNLLADAARQLKSPGVNKASAKYVPPHGIAFDEATFTGDAYATFSWAVNIAELDIDQSTGQTKLKDFVAVQDAGKIINPTLAAGQIEGGVAQGIGFALMEEVTYEEGRVWNQRMANYTIPTAADLPPIRVFFLNSDASQAKGLGELPMNAPAPAIANALSRQLGTNFNHLPITPEKILKCDRSR